MCFDGKLFVTLVLVAMAACVPYGKIQKIRSGHVELGLSVPEDKVVADPEDQVSVDSIRASLSDDPIIMRAIRDTDTGEMVATDMINASKVTARFRNVAERDGYVTIGFDVTVPGTMSESCWQLKIFPRMRIQEDTVSLDPVFITGKAYRDMQLRGYQRYKAFLASIITDTTDLVRMGQLEIFLKRNYPAIYSMRNDTSIVSYPYAENLFGVTQKEAMEHYTRHLKMRHNEWKKRNSVRMFRRYVKDPIVREGIRLDTVLTEGGTFIYRYVHTFRSRPSLKKVILTVEGQLYDKGKSILQLPISDGLTFYISSLSTLADMRPKYRMLIKERNVYDHTKALIDFRQGSAEVDTLLGDNASEFRRICNCIDDVKSRKEFVLDSLVIMASCSPEGSYDLNYKLSAMRSAAVRKYIGQFVPEEWKDSLKTRVMPENWEYLRLLVRNDSVIGEAAVKKILKMTDNLKYPDKTERQLAALPQYRYLRQKIYPRLRSVSFDFHLHRVGMLKDTIHTTELDTLYMEGLRSLESLDYKRAVALLRPYGDYNSALAFISAGYNHSALDVLERLDERDPKVCYMKALILARMEQYDEAMKLYELCLAYDPYLEFRANLDPEMSVLVSRRNKMMKQ